MTVEFYAYSLYESKNDWTFKIVPTLVISRDVPFGYVFDISIQWLFFDISLEFKNKETK
jgi:hypothetical protein